MRTVGQFTDGVREVENRWIARLDGCRLAARGETIGCVSGSRVDER